MIFVLHKASLPINFNLSFDLKIIEMKICTFLFAVANATLKEDTQLWLVDTWWKSAYNTFNVSTDWPRFYSTVDGVSSKFNHYIPFRYKIQ